jgi:hypothetical protein
VFAGQIKGHTGAPGFSATFRMAMFWVIFLKIHRGERIRSLIK